MSQLVLNDPVDYLQPLSLIRRIAVLFLMSWLTSAAATCAATAARRRMIWPLRSSQGFASPVLKRHPIQVMYDALSNASILASSTQTLYNTLENPLSDENLSSCLEAMNQVQLSDLGFDEGDINGIDESVCATIAITKQFNIAVFMIPKGHCLPLHDHPSMTVLSKVIRGELDMKAFTILRNAPAEDPSNTDNQNINGIKTEGTMIRNGDSIAAKLTCQSVKTSKDPAWFLTPTSDNVHEFRAVTNCVVLDCLLPPYHEPERPCNFYKATPLTSSSNADIPAIENDNSPSPLTNWWLLKIPEDSHSLPHTIEYSGIRPVKESKGYLSNERWDRYFS